MALARRLPLREERDQEQAETARRYTTRKPTPENSHAPSTGPLWHIGSSTEPLSGKELRLVGHTDPRGDADYNRVLGGRRADGVRDFLVKRGLKPGRIATTSRGKLDAEGTSEPGWAKDRRVDVKLAD